MAWYDYVQPDDMFNSSTLGGAGAGALAGAPLGPVGIIGGGLLGGMAGYFQHRGAKKKQEAIGQARMEMERLAREQRAQREADLSRAMGFFGPVRDEMSRLYRR
jgi:hypothetical protein